MATNVFNGTTDLGPTPEMFAAFSHFGALSPGMEYDALHGALHAVLAGDDQLSSDYLSRVALQADHFEDEFGEKLDEHEKWVLRQLASANGAKG